MQRDILFYQANFEPEVNRMIDAFENKNEKYFELFKNKTLKIVENILNLSNKFSEKEEWNVVKNLIESFSFLNIEEKEILRKYGNCFSLKFAKILNN